MMILLLNHLKLILVCISDNSIITLSGIHKVFKFENHNDNYLVFMMDKQEQKIYILLFNDF
jgi:hypothetical protein